MSIALRIHTKHIIEYSEPLLYKKDIYPLIEYLKEYELYTEEGESSSTYEIAQENLISAITNCTDDEIKKVLVRMLDHVSPEGYIYFSVF